MSQKPEIEKAVYNIYEVAALMGINLPKAYKMVRQESFPSIRIGRRIVVPKEAFRRWLEEAAFNKQSYDTTKSQ